MRPDGVALMGAPAPAGVSRSGGLAARAPETWGAPDPPYLKPVQHRGQYSRPHRPRSPPPGLGFQRERGGRIDPLPRERISSGPAKVPLIPRQLRTSPRRPLCPGRSAGVGQGRVSRGGHLPKVLRSVQSLPGVPPTPRFLSECHRPRPASSNSLPSRPQLDAGLLASVPTTRSPSRMVPGGGGWGVPGPRPL